MNISETFFAIVIGAPALATVVGIAVSFLPLSAAERAAMEHRDRTFPKRTGTVSITSTNLRRFR